MKKIINIKWTNKFSKETGYVKSIQNKKGYFEATFSKDSARKYKSFSEANNCLDILYRLCPDNTYEIIES